MYENTVVSNSTALIFLAKINKLNLLRDIFGKIIIPEEVYFEVAVKGCGRPGSEEIRLAIKDWIIVKKVRNKELKKLLSLILDEGEAACIALALEIKADYVILDDLMARKIAGSLELNIIGTIGIILLAKKLKLIDNPKSIILSLRRAGFWLSENLLKKVLELAEDK